MFSTGQPLPLADAAPGLRTDRAKFFRIFLNTTACYLLGWLAVNFFYQAGTAFVAHRYHVPGRWSLAGVRFVMPDTGWRRTVVIHVYGMGPLLALGLGIGAFAWFGLRQFRYPGLAKVLLLWLGFHALNQVCGGLLADTVTQTGWWYVPNWAANNGGVWVSTMLGVLLGLAQLLLGYVLAIPFMLAQDSHTILQFDNRFALLGYALLGPWVAGSALLALSKTPHLSLNEGLHYATMGLLLVPLALGLHRPFQAGREVLPQPTHVAWGLVALGLLGLLGWRLVLGGVGLRL